MNFMATILLMIMLCTVQTLDDWTPNTTHVIDSHLFSQRFCSHRTQCQSQSSPDSTPSPAQPLIVQQLLHSQKYTGISLSISLHSVGALHFPLGIGSDCALTSYQSALYLSYLFFNYN